MSDIKEVMETESVGMDANEYNNKMIEAFVAKPMDPAKNQWYKNSFTKYSFGGIDSMKWNWSWWAFFGGWVFLLYRKAYIPSLVLFVLTIVITFIPFAPLILWILTGGFSSYFVYKTYQTNKMKIELMEKDDTQRIALMQHMGGYNGWVAWVIGGIYGLIVLGLIAVALSALAGVN